VLDTVDNPDRGRKGYVLAATRERLRHIDTTGRCTPARSATSCSVKVAVTARPFVLVVDDRTRVEAAVQ